MFHARFRLIVSKSAILLLATYLCDVLQKQTLRGGSDALFIAELQIRVEGLGIARSCVQS
jgi:hypothetical protein